MFWQFLHINALIFRSLSRSVAQSLIIYNLFIGNLLLDLFKVFQKAISPLFFFFVIRNINLPVTTHEFWLASRSLLDGGKRIGGNGFYPHSGNFINCIDPRMKD